MNPLMFKPWMYLGIAAVMLGLLTFAGCEHSNAKSARADEKVAIDGRNTALDANKSLLVTVASQKNTIEVWKRLATPSAHMKAAAARAADLERQNDILNAALAKRAELDYAKPDCVKVLETDVELICPGIFGGMRERASRYENRDRRSSSTSSGEDRPLFD
jgi:hypothetical protein